MAVYTKLTEEDIKKILSNYSIGKLDKFENIEEGIEKGVNYNTSPQAILSLYSGALDKMIRDQIFIKRWIELIKNYIAFVLK